MLYQVFAVRDRAADVFGVPMFLTAVGIAIRGFSDEVNRVDANNQLNKHPEDFDLYHLGTYEDAHGTFNLLPAPRQIAIGKDVIRS